MRPKSLCMRYFFVDAPAYCIKNAFLWNASAHLQKKVVHTCSRFFVDALAHYIKTHIICGMHQCIYKKVVHTQAFRMHFRLTWSPKPETGTRNPKPKPFKKRPSTEQPNSPKTESDQIVCHTLLRCDTECSIPLPFL